MKLQYHAVQLGAFVALLSATALAQDGAHASAGLAIDSAGTLYGTTQFGGPSGNGAVFKVDPAGHAVLLYSPPSRSGSFNPIAGVTPDPSGSLFGTIPGVPGAEGASSHGAVYKIDSNGKLTRPHLFCSLPNCADGSQPLGRVVVDASGNLYGTTSSGGNSNSAYSEGAGVVFKIGSSGKYTVLHRFCATDGCADGARPIAGLSLDSAGNMYGTTSLGGAHNSAGVVFRIDAAGTYSVLHNFCSAANCADGVNPNSELLVDESGNLYGLTAAGGNTRAAGVLYRIDNSGSFAVLHSFCSESNCADGSGPGGSLALDAAGNLYGVTRNGGDANTQQTPGSGILYRLDRFGSFAVLHNFCSEKACSDGRNPVGGLVMDVNGSFYGITQYGGYTSASVANGAGVVYKLSPSGSFSSVHNFLSGPAGQIISFSPVSDQPLGASPVSLDAAASSGLPVILTSATPAVCSVSGGSVALLGPGKCTVEVNQAGNAVFTAAAPASLSFQVTRDAGITAQTIAFGPIASPQQYTPSPFALSASASSGLPVAFASLTPQTCVVGALGPQPQAYIASTFAGIGGVGAYSGDGGLATSAQLFNPLAVALDASGNLYLADWKNNRVRMVTPAGIISTVAGNGTPGYSGDGGLATNAALFQPSGVAFDSSGNLYIADFNNFRIRKVTPGPAGIITTVAGNGTSGSAGDGGPATAAQLNLPISIAIDPADNLYIADYQNNKVRKVNLASGIITTVAGTGVGGFSGDGGPATSAKLQGPKGVALDAAGNLYISDSTNSRIRKVTAATGIITTVVGNGVRGFGGDGGLATSASLNLPQNIVFDSAGNLIIADNQNNRIRWVNPSGIINTLAGTGAAGYAGDGGPATSAQFSGPQAILLDAVGNIYIPDKNNNVVRVLTAPLATAATGFVGIGTCTIQASQQGNATFAPAKPVTQTFQVTQASQTITFGALRDRTRSETPFVVSAGASSGLPVSFGSATPAVCTVSGNTVNLLIEGLCTLQATQPGNLFYLAAPPASQSFSVLPNTQTITFNLIPPQVYGNPPFTLIATSSSGLAVSFASLTPAVCAVSGNTATIATGGTCSIQATQPGNSQYLPATPVNQDVAIMKAAQTITVGAIPTQTYGNAPFTVTATATSGLAVTLATQTPAVCSFSGNTLTILAAGTCGIQATQSGDLNYQAAPAVNVTIPVAKASQTITFSTISNQIFGTAPFALIASVSSGLPLTFVSSTTPVCTVSGSALTIVNVGQCTIVASQAGNGNYLAAASVPQSFQVQPSPQSINFPAISNHTFGDAPFAITANATSGLAVGLASQTSSVCALSGTTVTILAAGTCSILATQPGNAQYLAAAPITQTFTIFKASQSVTFGAVAGQTYGNPPFAVTATATSGLPVTLASLTPSVCSISGNIVTILSAGACIIQGNQPGNANYFPAAATNLQISISQLPQVITFNPISNQTIGTPPFAISATASSGLPVTLASLTPGVCTLSGNLVTLVSVGGCTIQATQSGTVNIQAAVPVNQSFNVLAGSQTISFGTVPNQAYGTPPFNVNATASSGSPVSFASLTPSSCVVPGTPVLGSLYAIATFAGTGAAGFSGDGGPATSALLNQPPVAAVDASGNIYIADLANNRIRKVTAAGIITTIAGTGIAGFSGDGGPALVAQLNNPSGVTLDAAGSIYVADSRNNRIRVISPSGIITTFAGNGTAGSSGNGGPATSAQLNLPTSTSLDQAGNFYITEYTGNRVRKVSAAGIITLFAGTGVKGFAGDGGPAVSAAFNNPSGSWVDLGGNVYIADYSNSRIRVVNAAGIVNTFAGNGAAGFSGDGGPPTSAALNGPKSVVVDAAGNVFIGDQNNNRVRKVSGGIINTITGTGGAAYAGDGGPALSAQLNRPAGIGIDTAGNVFVADRLNSAIRVLTIPVSSNTVSITGVGTCTLQATQTGTPNYAPAKAATQSFQIAQGSQTIAFPAIPGHTIGDSPFPIAASASSGLPVNLSSLTPAVCSVAGNVVTLLAGGACTIQANQPGNANYFPATPVNQGFQIGLLPQTINFPGPLPDQFFGASPFPVSATASSGLPVILLSLTSAACTVSGNIVTLAGIGTCTIQANQPGNAIYLPAAPVSQSFQVRQGSQTINFGPIPGQSVGSIITVTPTATSALPVGLVSLTPPICTVNGGAAGSLAIASLAGNGAGGYSGDGGPALNAQMSAPSGTATDAAGNLYIADTINNRVRIVTPAGIISTFAGNGTAGSSGDNGPATGAQLNQPTGVAVDQAGNVYIADLKNNKIRKVTPAGIISTFAGLGAKGSTGDGGPAISAKLSSPSGVSADTAGNVYIADYGNNKIRKVNTAGTISTFAGTGVAGFGGDGGPATSALFNGPIAVSADAAGNVYIADSLNNRVRKVTTGAVSTVAGNGTAGFSGDGGAATSAALNAPRSVVADSAGSLYISDQGNNRIRVVSTIGIISTLSGNGIGSYTGDGGLAGNAQLNQPAGLWIDTAGNLFVADRSNNAARVITLPRNSNSVTLVTAGTCELQATQTGNANVTPAQPVNQSFAVR